MCPIHQISRVKSKLTAHSNINTLFLYTAYLATVQFSSQLRIYSNISLDLHIKVSFETFICFCLLFKVSPFRFAGCWRRVKINDAGSRVNLRTNKNGRNAKNLLNFQCQLQKHAVYMYLEGTKSFGVYIGCLFCCECNSVLF